MEKHVCENLFFIVGKPFLMCSHIFPFIITTSALVLVWEHELCMFERINNRVCDAECFCILKHAIEAFWPDLYKSVILYIESYLTPLLHADKPIFVEIEVFVCGSR